MAVSQEYINELNDIANILRIHSIQMTDASKSGHPTSCASIAEILSVLFFKTLRYNLTEPKHKSSDRFILSKGHAAPILYAAWAEAGLFPTSTLMDLRKVTSDLEGHPTPRLNFIDVATGSLGQGLSVACGMAYVGKYYDKASYRVYCLIGDGESAEGSIWEAMAFASYYKLDNLVAIFDVNRLGQSDPTPLQHNVEVYSKRCEAFGFQPIVVDGHSVPELLKAFQQASDTKSKPTAIIAVTYKGKMFPSIENVENWHGKPLGNKSAEVINHLQSLIANKKPKLVKISPIVDDAPNVNINNVMLSSAPSYKPDEKVATRAAYGTALYKLAQTSNRVIALDGDTKNSTFSCKIMEVNKEQYIECFIAEQNLCGVAMGVACRDRAITFVSTFASFFTRAFDQIRMGAISQTNTNFAGSHCGVSIGEDGPSQMGLEDLSLFRSIPGCTVFYPSDAVSCERAVELAANTRGICYIRTSRPATTMVYANDTKFKIGESHIVHGSGKGGEQALIIGAGVTLHEALKAAKQLSDNNIKICVLDPFTVKPLDKNIIKYAKACGNNVLVVEDHYAEGGLGDAVCNLLSEEVGVRVRCLAVREVPRSGPPDVLLDKYGISCKHIINEICSIVKK